MRAWMPATVAVAVAAGATVAAMSLRGDDVDLQGAWHVDRVVDRGDVTQFDPAYGDPVLWIGGGQANISDGCTSRRYGMDVEGATVDLELDQEDRTFGMCHLYDPSHGIVVMVERVDHASVHGHHLVLTGPDLRLELSPPQPGLPIPPDVLDIDGGWLLVAGRYDDRPVPILAATPASLDMYDHEGQLRTGCNTAGVTLGAQWFELGYATQMGCPGTVSRVERMLFHAIEDVDRARVTRRTLHLGGPHTSLDFRAVARPGPGRIAGRWRIVATRRGGVTTSATHERSVRIRPAYLVIGPDLTFRLHSGCRRIDGEWTNTQAQVWLQVTRASAKGSCPESASAEEFRVESAVLGSARFVRHGSRLDWQDYTGAGLLLRRAARAR